MPSGSIHVQGQILDIWLHFKQTVQEQIQQKTTKQNEQVTDKVISYTLVQVGLY